MANNPAQRQQQADAVTSAVATWLAGVNAWDAATADLEAAQAANNAAFRAWNAVAWKTDEHSGASATDKAQAFVLKAAWEDAAQKVPPLMQAAVAAANQRNIGQNAVTSAGEALKQNPGAVENMGGTLLG
jgi:hypothetical protein